MHILMTDILKFSYKKNPVILDYIKLRIQKLENIRNTKKIKTEASWKAIFKCQDQLKVLMEIINDFSSALKQIIKNGSEDSPWSG